MFERYTEKARRVIFFARYEASQFGSWVIDTQHLLLGLLREEKQVCISWIPKAQPDAIRSAIEGWAKRPAPVVGVDLPLSDASKRVLANAIEEADRLSHKRIGTEHLLLGLLQEKCPASDLLIELGADLGKLRAKLEESPDPTPPSQSDMT
jgi:ATP-dependent Clp protease ATP-binding subunit ClpC